MKTTLRIAIGIMTAALIAGCVKEHPDRVEQEGDVNVFSLEELKATYVVDGSNLVGCEQVNLEGTVTTIEEPGKDPVVIEQNGDTVTRCVNPSAVPLNTERPPVHYMKAPSAGKYLLLTRGVVRSAGLTKATEGISVEGLVDIKPFNIVDFRTNSPFLERHTGNVELKALPSTSYEVMHKVTPNHLIVMRVSEKEGVSHLELPYADNLGNGKYAVPLGYYSIETLRPKKIRNADDEETNQLRYYPEPELALATHIRLDLNDFEKFSIEKKEDVYPADYFVKGQWYFSESVVDTRPGGEGSIGTNTGAFDFDFRPASKIKFFRTSSSIVGYNIGVDERIRTDQPINLSPVVTIPTISKAYQLNIAGTEEELADDIDETKTPYFEMNFHKTKTLKNIGFSILGGFGTEEEIIDVKFAEESFSFTLQQAVTGRRVRYSFLRAEGRTPYASRRHYKSDRETFGYFVQTKAKIFSSDEEPREEDIEKNFFIQRHNPKEPIKFYFSHLTPDYACGDVDPYDLNIDYRDLGRRAVAYWDAAFKRAGAPHGVELVESGTCNKDQDAPFGDISFNTINLIDSVQGSNLLGVGPSLVDPFTGEVINTNANVYIAPFRTILAGDIRDYIRSRLGLVDDQSSQLPLSARTTSTLITDTLNSINGVKAFIANMLPAPLMKVVANLYHHRTVGIIPTADMSEQDYSLNSTDYLDLYGVSEFYGSNRFVKSLVQVAEQIPEVLARRDLGQVKFNIDAPDYGIRSRHDLNKLTREVEHYRPTFYRAFFVSENLRSNPFNSMTRDIEVRCDEVVAFVAEVLQKTSEGQKPSITTAQEEKALKSCMAKLIPEKFLATLVHEMGHNLGLRHNFYGSADKKNFMNVSEVKEIYELSVDSEELPKSSSVMDYVRSKQDRLFFPGHYDIAAIRYGYTNQVEVTSTNLSRPNSRASVYVDITENKELGPNGSIQASLARENKTRREISFCTDVKAILEVDPLCARHDFGTTPEESVDDAINDFWESFTLYNSRLDRLQPGLSGPLFRIRSLSRLKRMYDEWRFRLSDYLGSRNIPGNEYLERFSAEEYAELIATLEADENFPGREYLRVRKKIFDFITEVAFFPNKYCLVQTGVEGVPLKALEFEKLRDELKDKVPADTKVVSCSDPLIAGTEDGKIEGILGQKGFSLVSEVGLPVNNLWDYVNPADTFQESGVQNNFRKPIDTIGTFVDRFFASNNLGQRNRGGFSNQLEELFPNMLDEPDLYLEYEARVVSRMVDGADLTDIVSRVDGISFPEGQRLVLPNFEEESGFLKAMWLSLEQGIRNPVVNNFDRVTKYRRSVTEDLDQIQQAQQNGGIVIPLANTLGSLVIPRESEVAVGLANKFIELNQQAAAANIEVESNEQVLQGLVPVLGPLFGQLPETLEELTPQQYMVFARNTLAAVTEMGPAPGSVMQELFIGDLVIYLVLLRGADEHIEQSKAAGVDPNPQAVADLERALNDLQTRGMDVVAAELQEQFGSQLPGGEVRVPTRTSMITRFQTEGPAAAERALAPLREQVAQAKAVFDLNREDIFAQMDLLRSILTFDVQEAAQSFATQLFELFGDRPENLINDYGKLSKSTRSDVRFFMKSYFEPAKVLEDQFGIESPTKKFERIGQRSLTQL